MHDTAKSKRRPGRSAQPLPRFAPERQQHVAALLREQGRVEVAALAQALSISEDTVRRDLNALAARGLAQKTHGGAVALHSAALPTAQRAAVQTGAKRAIGRAASALVQAGQTVFVDGGTTTLALVEQLKAPGSPRPLTVITHALDIALALTDEPQVRLVLAGGRWLPDARIFVGDAAVAVIAAHRADVAFLGACALHPRAGLTAYIAEEAPLKRAMVQGAARRVLLTDATKLDAVDANAVAALDELDLVISDAAPGWLKSRVKIELV